jgi:hypothetical protein
MTIRDVAQTEKSDKTRFLRCVGCGAEGRLPSIVWDRAALPDPLPTLRPAFDWGDPPRTVLLCGRCQGLRP